MQTRLHEFAMGSVRFARTLPDTAGGREWGGLLTRIYRRVSCLPGEPPRESTADWLDKIADCVEELDECDNWFSVIDDSKLRAVPKNLRPEAQEVRAILAKSLATGRANERRRNDQSKRKPREEAS